MKVILAAKSVYPFHPFGGVQKYVYYFAKSLARQGVDLEIVAPVDGGKPRTEGFDGLTYRLLSPAIYKYLEYPVGWVGVHLFSRSLAKYLRSARFDLLHSFDLTGYQYLRTPERKPTVAHIFTDNYLCNPIPLGGIANVANFDKIKETKIKLSPFDDWKVKAQYLPQYLLKVKPLRSVLTRSDAVFFEDDLFLKEVAELYRADTSKSHVVPVGIDLSYVQQALPGGSLSREQLGLALNDVVLITVNRLAADKGVDKIIAALEMLVEQEPRTKLIIIGSGYQEKELLEMIAQKGLAGYVRHFKDVPEKDLYQYYKISDIYLCAFSYPGSSISTLEAMACSLPIVTTAQPWLVQEGENGLVLKDNDPCSIRDAVLRLVQEDKLKEQGVISRIIVQKFEWENIAKKAVEKYEEILRKDPRIASAG